MKQPIRSRLAKWGVLGAFAMSLAYATPAHAFIHLSVLGVGYSPEPSETLFGNTVTTSSTFKIGFGGQLGIGFFPMTELEIGAFYYNRAYSGSATIQGAAFNQTFSEPILEVPVDLRIQLGMLYVRGGVYADVATGQVSYTSGGVSSTESLSDASLTPWDYGALVGAGIDIPLGPAMAITAGVQYQLQISNSSSNAATGLYPNDSAKFNSLLFTAGLRLGF